MQEPYGSYKSHYVESKNAQNAPVSRSLVTHADVALFYDGDQEMHTRGGKGPDSG